MDEMVQANARRASMVLEALNVLNPEARLMTLLTAATTIIETIAPTPQGRLNVVDQLLGPTLSEWAAAVKAHAGSAQ